MAMFEQNRRRTEAKDKKTELQKHFAEFKSASTIADLKAALEKILKEALPELKE